MSTFPDKLFESGGKPVSGGYQGMWGNKSLFVDYDNGNDSLSGKTTKFAYKTIDTAIAAAGEWDTIYVRPVDPDSSGGDPKHYLPVSTTANPSITYLKHGLSIVGTGFGSGTKSRANMVRMQGASGVTGPVLTIKAPFVNIEGLGFKRGSSTDSAIKILGQDGSTGYAFGVTINDCLFWKIGATATNGAVYIESAWHNVIDNCVFEECAEGITIGVSYSSVVGVNVMNTLFSGIAATIAADIQGGGTLTEVLIDNCIFAHDIPALASPSLYIVFSTASGTLSRCYFGSETATIATNMTISNCDLIECKYAAGTNLVA